jgi:hypothetical protein
MREMNHIKHIMMSIGKMLLESFSPLLTAGPAAGTGVSRADGGGLPAGTGVVRVDSGELSGGGDEVTGDSEGEGDGDEVTGDGEGDGDGDEVTGDGDEVTGDGEGGNAEYAAVMAGPCTRGCLFALAISASIHGRSG